MKLSVENPTKIRFDRLWVWGLAAVLVAFVFFQAVRELILARDSLAFIFQTLTEAIQKLIAGNPAQAVKFFSKWGLTTLELLLFLAFLAAGPAAGLALWKGAAGRAPGRFATLIERHPWLGWLLAILIAAYPAFLLWSTTWGDAFAGPYLRLWLLVSAGLLAGACLQGTNAAEFAAVRVMLGLALTGSLFLIGGQLVTVTNYPFSLTWSEGNRLYEYSIYFSPGRYQYAGELNTTRGAAGRYLLWGLPFLIPEAPIWVHRLWNALLSTLPHLALGFILAWPANLPRRIKLLLALWIFLFLAQGPIYTPLILSAILMALFVRPGKWLSGGIAAAISGYYASLSRWTWLLAAPAWALFFLLPGLDEEESSYKPGWNVPTFRRLIPVAIVTVAGLAGGLLANPRLFMPQKLAQGDALKQPLLWYRLFPNATYPTGVLLALLMACAPALILLFWLAASRRWKLNRLERLVHPLVLLVFLAGGLVASMKIGGGNNLHNLDMFLVSLAILAGLAARRVDWRRTAPQPALARLLLAVAVLLPAWTAVRSGTPLKLPPAESTRKALENIRLTVQDAAQNGDVLLMDQRQLLTFGNIQDTQLFPEYEKKYMMDQAMASDSAYFEGFYRDLAAQRFALIVSDIQFQRLKDSTVAFGEENNAWVQWVSQPLLCYYMPLRTYQNVDIQLLVPNPDANDCAHP